MRTFHVHKNLLAQASDYFDRALNGDFAESAGTIDLHRHCPIAFEVVYQWLYSGRKLTAEEVAELRHYSQRYEKSEDGLSLFWMRLFNLADETMIVELKVYAYENLLMFCGKSTADMMAASDSLVKELFDPESRQPILQEYFAWVAAYILYCSTAAMPKEWQDSWKDTPEYATLILNRIVALSANRKNAHTMHPADDPKFSVKTVFGEEHES